jgi:hypothetical protein
MAAEALQLASFVVLILVGLFWLTLLVAVQVKLRKIEKALVVRERCCKKDLNARSRARNPNGIP